MKSIFTLAALLVVPLLLVHGAERKFSQNFSVAPGGTLDLKTDRGSVKVVGTDAKTVSVVAVMRGSESSLDDFTVEASQTDGEVRVRGTMKNPAWFWESSDPEVQFTISVPREYSALLGTSGGDLSVINLKGKVDGETSGGNIRLEAIGGTMTMETSGGNVHAERIEGEMRVETSGGNIVVSEVRGNISVSTSGGEISIGGVDGKIRAETSGGSIAVKVHDRNQGVYAETSGGDIDITLPVSARAMIDASTTGGEVTCELPLTTTGKIDESRVRGTVNGGGELIHAYTSGGNVRILALK